MDAPELGSLLDVDSESEVSVQRFAAGSQHREPVSLIIDSPTHLLIVVGEDAQVTVEVTVRSTCSMEIIAEENASVTVICVQQTSGSIRQRSSIGAGASIKFQNVTLASEVEHHVQSHLTGRGATSDIDWIFYAKDKDTQDLTARNMFEAAEGGGEITMKGIAEQNAYVRCDGLIDIGLQGGGTDTYLSEDVLMLDDTAKVDAIPGLEIKTNDVKASHSATISKVTPEDLFYFASRGIAEKEARRMYVQGFLGDLTKRIEHTALRESVLEKIIARY
ncbi:MAG: SufD family Fe-S cluster assembly protein [Candidatus Peribacter sp.]|jgi:Fe-S cluster assembly scaffold protein SufB|nr:SufD family Fe-S cluster assembly protein [Candidatus Peribacter sp.]MBT4393132.1 SufD family Fe-S cluster assembly protein [Candidatus Peribacter sp.]MBT4600931.1 SufD family Fe-S cluster assembly protein [Candidatus Peribacter sp.]MBT5148939.1 SufD family Fe-S cluster assembly protein [Candidatus Peribacter sp.]MBT5638382.1 SufD family Fe-S cluster assembly protein [Candidatus Peribacter sp.]